jgi:hypothetical protein
MLKKSLAVLAALVVSSLSTMSAQATTVVFNNASNGALRIQSAVYNLSTDPGFQWGMDGDQQAYDYFHVNSAITFDRINWTGSNSDGDFAVGMFTATCFSCGASLATSGGTISNSILPSAGPFTQTQVHKTLLSSGLYSYHVDLASSVTLDPKTFNYGLTITNNYTTDPFAWGGSDSTVNTRFLIDSSLYSKFLPSPGQLAFSLSSEAAPVSAVPLPATGLMLLGGLGVLAARRSRRAAKSVVAV